MALIYQTSPQGVFFRIGLIVKAITEHSSDAVTLENDLVSIITSYQDAGASTTQLYVQQVVDLPAYVDTLRSSVVQLRQGYAGYVDQTLLDKDTVLTQLVGQPGPQVSDMLLALWEQMKNDGQTVQSNTVVLGSPAAPTGRNNFGNGFVIPTKTLDGQSIPVTGGIANPNWNGLASELACSNEIMTLICVADNGLNGTLIGGETFTWGGNPVSQAFDYIPEGSGPGPNINVSNFAPGIAVIQDPGFANWQGNTPNSWTVVGTIGTNIFDNTTASNIWTGANSAQLTGDGATNPISLSQPIATSLSNQSLRRFIVAVMIKASAVPATGTFTMSLFSPSGAYLPSSGSTQIQKIVVSGATGGTYQVGWTGAYGGPQTTVNINATDVAATVQAKLRALIGLESVVVSQSGSSPNFTNLITMSGVYGNASLFSIAQNALTGGGSAAVSQTLAGIAGEQVVLSAPAFPSNGSLPNGFALRYFHVNLPDPIPSDLELLLSVTGPLSAGVSLYLDSMAFDGVNYFAGHGVNVLAGSVPWHVTDQIVYTVGNDNGGNFQTFWKLWYRFQLPSSTTPTIPDSLAASFVLWNTTSTLWNLAAWNWN